MTYGIGTLDYAPLRHSRGMGILLRQTAPGAIALACGALVGAYILYSRPDGAPSYRVAVDATGIRTVAQAAPPVMPGIGAATTGLRAAAESHRDAAQIVARVAAPNPYGELLDPGLSAAAPALFADSVPLGSEFALLPSITPDTTSNADSAAQQAPDAKPALQVAEAVPMPAPRPAELAVEPTAPATPEVADSVPVPAPRPPEFRLPANSAPMPAPVRQLAEKAKPAAPAPTAVASAKPDTRSFFEKLFGVQPQRSGALAYASAEDGAIGLRGVVPGYDRQTAIYNIATHTVYLPDGRRLEAHSGLGSLLDDPRHVNQKNRGATPPAVYELQPREQLFHGVQALRLNPVGGQVYGRNGLLAHTYMLGPHGDSNGCVSFKNYNAFLQAYMKGEVRRLVVVAGL